MTILTKKFSQFLSKPVPTQGDQIVGLSGGNNAIYNAYAENYSPLPRYSVSTLIQQMVPYSGYVTNNMGLITFKLPKVCEFGSIFEIIGFSSGGWVIAQNAGQQIFSGVVATTQGITGFLASTNPRDSIVLLCVVANTSFVNLTPPQGNPTVN
jgi:hypothetical protein